MRLTNEAEPETYEEQSVARLETAIKAARDQVKRIERARTRRPKKEEKNA
jgi:hypothetical protein